jgi:L-ascorbate metabolism protein UlaG (beta-lactamase superfamily)
MKSFGARASGERLERMQASPRWVDGGFRNLHPIAPGLRSSTVPRPTLGEFLCADAARTPPRPLPAHDPRSAWQRAPDSGLRTTWLGHSTVLIEIDGYRVLTDPVWGTRASPFRLVGPKRFQPMPLRLRDLPAVDAVVISHDHYDHLDFPTITALARHTQVPFVTSLGVGAHLQAWGVAPERITELDWWDTHTVLGTGLQVTAAPSQHFSGRGLKDRNATLWSSLVVAGPRHRVFFSGDTGLTSEYQTIRDRLGPFDLVMLEVGAYHPSWGDIHLGPENALLAQAMLGGAPLLPVHWGTFSLALHAWDQPVEALLAGAQRSGAALLMPSPGQVVEPAQRGAVHPWWRALGAPPNAPSSGGVVDSTPTSGRLQAGLPWPLD